jgi:hypothetical protein
VLEAWAYSLAAADGAAARHGRSQQPVQRGLVQQRARVLRALEPRRERLLRQLPHRLGAAGGAQQARAERREVELQLAQPAATERLQAEALDEGLEGEGGDRADEGGLRWGGGAGAALMGRA